MSNKKTNHPPDQNSQPETVKAQKKPYTKPALYEEEILEGILATCTSAHGSAKVSHVACIVNVS